MSSDRISLTRDQLREFLPDQRAIIAFEQLFQFSTETLPIDIIALQRSIEEIALDAGTAISASELALALLTEIENRIAMASLAPVASTGLSSDQELQLELLSLAPPTSSQHEGIITPGTTAQYWRGDKTWQDFATAVRASVLTGLSTATNAVITAADTVLSAFGKLQKQFSDHFAGTAEHGATGAVVGTTNTQTLTNKTLTSPIISTISNTGTLTLPTSTDTLVGRATTDTLTNKTLTTPIIAQISNTGTLTLPTSTDTLVGKATTDTFTNKTFDTAGTGNVFRINGTGITAKTGTGAVVLDTSPTLVTPNIGAATGTSINLSGSGTFSQTAGIIGTTTNNNANTGSVGEYVTATASSVSITSTVSKDITSISLTAGDWDISGTMQFNPAAGTILSQQVGSVSSTSNTLGSLGEFFSLFTSTTASAGSVFPTPVVRKSLSATTTIYLVANGTFTVSTCTASAVIRARRVR